MLKRALPIIMFLVLILAVRAEQFDVSIPESILAVEGQATIPLTITNMQPFNDEYIISALDFNWLIDNISDANVPQGQTKTINVLLKASQDIETKSYGIKIKIKSLSGKEIEKIARIDVKNPDEVFKIKILGPEALDPRKDTNKLSLQFENVYDNDFGNMTVILQSSALSETKSISLGPREIKQEELTIKIPADTQEGDHLTSVLFYQDNKLVANQTIMLKISQYSGVREVSSEEKSIFTSKETIKKINDGNAISFQKYVKTLTFMQKLFTSTDPVPDSLLKSDENYVLTWDIRLEPGQEKEIVITTNYRNPLIIFSLLIILIIIVYFRLRKDIVINKKALIVGSERGGISKIKVNLVLYNKGKKVIHNIKLMERVPGTHEDPSEFTTLKPFKTSKWSTGLNMIWKIESIAPKEEKIVEYKIGARMHLGKLLLPPTLAQYVQGNKTVISKSKSIKIKK